MGWNPVPAKTPQGLAELSQRALGLSQRHRTMLLLVDGRRPLAQVLDMGQAAGVPRTVFDELVELGLVTRPEPVATEAGANLDAQAVNSAPVPLPTTGPAPLTSTAPAPLAATAPATLPQAEPLSVAGNESSLLPAARSLLPESSWSLLDTPADPDGEDRPLKEARDILVRAVRQAAPVTGSLTIMKLKRAESREALEALLDEVEQRLRKPHRQIVAAQTMRHVRHILSMPPHSDL